MHAGVRNQSQVFFSYLSTLVLEHSSSQNWEIAYLASKSQGTCLHLPIAQVEIQVHTTEAWVFFFFHIGKLRSTSCLHLKYFTNWIITLTQRLLIWKLVLFSFQYPPHTRNTKFVLMGWLRCQILVAYQDKNLKSGRKATDFEARHTWVWIPSFQFTHSPEMPSASFITSRVLLVCIRFKRRRVSWDFHMVTNYRFWQV